MNAAIKNALRKSPRIIIVDVEMRDDWLICGEPAICFQDRTSPYTRPYRLADIREVLTKTGTHEGHVREGKSYVHQYHVAENVPADIAAALRKN